MRTLKIRIFLISLFSVLAMASCDGNGTKENDKPEVEMTADQVNLSRAITLAKAAFGNYFDSGSGMTMHRYYNPYSKTRSAEIGSVWMYTASIEATVAIMDALKAQKEKGDAVLYDANYAFFKSSLDKLFEGLKYYQGTYTLTSYTQTASWTAYAVNRASSPGTADMSGVLNVYDDQMWLVRELCKAFEVTGESKYLEEAESLTAYVLDGWDCTIDSNGNENGGITWGPGYVTKHSCSNGPIISPLVWLAEHWSEIDKDAEITVGTISQDGTRNRVTMKKYQCYLEYAEKVYAYQKSHLLNEDGVYDDMMGGYRTGGGNVEYETIGGTRYRKNTALYDRVGHAISYNSGTMLSGAADLYKATHDQAYLDDLTSLTSKSFSYFAKLGTVKDGYYSYDITGFRNWFNDVLMRGYVDCVSLCGSAAAGIDSFQKNLDYAWDNFLYEDMLPTSLLGGWNMDRSKNSVEAMFTFAFASEYAVLAKYNLE